MLLGRRPKEKEEDAKRDEISSVQGLPEKLSLYDIPESVSPLIKE